MCRSNSTTWSNHLKLISRQYNLPCPLQLLETPPWPKEQWSSYVKTKITNWHENNMRYLSKTNSKMMYLQTDLLGLSGRPHPALLNINGTQDAKKLRAHLKFLTCDDNISFLLSDSSNSCVFCLSECSVEHVLISCPANQNTRERLLPSLLTIIADTQPSCALLQFHHDPSLLVQFILDCTSINLPDTFRIPAHNLGIARLFEMSRDWCFAIFNERSRQFKNL